MRVGVVIGRFQVPELHAGHEHLLDHVRANSDKVVVFLGVSPIDGHSAEYALTFSQRQAIFARSKYADAVTLPLMDMPNSKDWSLQLDATIHSLFPQDSIALYGGRNSFAQEYSGKYHVIPVPVNHTLSIVQGKDVREGLIEETSTEFLRGQIRALQRLFPVAYHTVDIACVRFDAENNPEVLLIQRKDNSEWGFVGGFVDPTDESAEYAAARELSEETGLSCASGAREAFKYVTSMKINDWRFRGSRNKVLTSFYMCQPMTEGVRINPDEVQDYKWIKMIQPQSIELVADVHKPLYRALMNHLHLIA